MEILSRYVVVIVLGICLCLGYIIKHSISFIPNRYIPLIMAVTGTILNVWINNWLFTPEILLGGLASGLASTGAFELVRNISESNLDLDYNVTNRNQDNAYVSNSKKDSSKKDSSKKDSRRENEAKL